MHGMGTWWVRQPCTCAALQLQPRQGWKSGEVERTRGGHIQVSDGVCCTWQEGVQFTDFKLPLNKYLPGAETIFKSLHCDLGTMNMAHILQMTKQKHIRMK